MAKIIDDETIENVCILAKLSLSDEAKEKAKEDMQKMLDYVEKLDELDTEEKDYGTGIDDSSGAGGKDQTAGSQRPGWCEGSL